MNLLSLMDLQGLATHVKETGEPYAYSSTSLIIGQFCTGHPSNLSLVHSQSAALPARHDGL